VLLISDDLDELLDLSSRIAVMSAGPSRRSCRRVREAAQLFSHLRFPKAWRSDNALSERCCGGEGLVLALPFGIGTEQGTSA
jgi:ABC-type nitrate/sulfonate/bicarbonate transport system ATPase subunit